MNDLVCKAPCVVEIKKCAIISVFFYLTIGASVVYADTCVKYSIAPRTISAPASSYASSGMFSLDEKGILVYDYGIAYGDLGKFRNPYFISNYANALYRDFINSDCKNESYKRAFLKQADYLVRSADYENGIASWRYPFRNEVFDLPPGWISGIGQARIAAVLLRAWGLTGNELYRGVAHDGMEAYKHTLVEGGVITKDNDVTWIEEAPSHDGRSYKILNGHITALSGIIDYGGLTGDQQWGDLVRRAVAAVRRDLPKFDAGFTSYYSLGQPGPDRIIAPREDYNALHVEQLLWLYDQTSDSEFLVWASRFQAYELNGYKYAAKGSVDPINHGPDQAAGLYGSRYWSHADFPTWVEVDLVEAKPVSGVWIDGNSQKASPRSYSVDAFVGGGIGRGFMV
ncbi:D-glucuronyl C5-epimerase family protein [Castellaniella sp.]|uniref:D-glucuronyl C5-epimerase family protein n=1 Tax=Castellaniella sp. TaxID=1955812 RepID=UPI003C724335